MDGVNGSFEGKNLEFVSGGDERCWRSKSTGENQGNSCSQLQDGYAGCQSEEPITSSKSVAVKLPTRSSSSSEDIDSEVVKPHQYEDHPVESSNHMALGADEGSPSSTQGSGESRVDTRDVDHPVESSNHMALGADEGSPSSTQGRGESRVDTRDVENTSPISESIVGNGDSAEIVSKRRPSESTHTGARTSTNLTQAPKRQWPKWPVSYLTSVSSMEKVMAYYRALDLAENLNDKDLRCFLEEQLSKERARLSETTIMNRLRTKLYVSAEAGEPDTCSICMIEYKNQDEIASLYYCPHQYHADCIKEWLRKINICPMCRALAIIPEDYPGWDGDVRLHQAFFVHLKYAT